MFISIEKYKPKTFQCTQKNIIHFSAKKYYSFQCKKNIIIIHKKNIIFYKQVCIAHGAKKNTNTETI